MSISVTPDFALERVVRLSGFNGWSVALFAGACTAITALFGDWTGVAAGLLVVLSGTMEVKGNRMLRRREKGGLRWLVRAQLFLMAVIFIYAVTRMVGVDHELAVENLSPAVRDAVYQLGLDRDSLRQLVRQMVWAFYGAVMLATCIYQGGLALYYKRRSGLVAQALDAPPVWTSTVRS